MHQEPDSDQAYRQYCLEIELHWSLARQVQTIVSPIVFEAIDRWQAAGIPAHVVVEAIHQFVTRKNKLKRQRHYLLTSVDGDVQKKFGEFQKAHVGEAQDDRTWHVRKISQIVQRLETVHIQHPLTEPIITPVMDRLLELDFSRPIDPEILETELTQWDQEMVYALWGCVSEADQVTFHEEVSGILGQEDDPEFFQRLLDDMLRYHFGVPRLSILG